MKHIGWRLALWWHGVWRKRFVRCLQCGCPNQRGSVMLTGGYRRVYPVCGHNFDDDIVTLRVVEWNKNIEKFGLKSRKEKQYTLPPKKR